MPNHDLTPDRIVAIRESMHLDRTNFAAAIGVSRVEVWRWEELGVRPQNIHVIEELQRHEAVMLRASQDETETE